MKLLIRILEATDKDVMYNMITRINKFADSSNIPIIDRAVVQGKGIQRLSDNSKTDSHFLAVDLWLLVCPGVHFRALNIFFMYIDDVQSL